MKKTFFLTLFIISVLSLVAQQNRTEAWALPTLGDEISAQATPFTPQHKAFGDLIWSEDFGGGALPSGWTVFDGNSMDWFWYWSDDPRPGIAGQYSLNNDTFYAETADNGYMMISGDIYNAGGSTAMDSYVMTGAMNFDTVTSALVSWTQYFRYCCNASTVLMQFSISTDGTNWTVFDVRENVAVNAWSPNPQNVAINITPFVAGQPVVYFKWYKGGASHYFWAIDDIKIVEAPENDVMISSTLVTNMGGGTYYSGYYSQMPTSQLMPILFSADVRNNGNAVQTEVNAYARVYDGTNTMIYENTDDTTGVSLVYDSIITLDMVPQFTAPGVDDYMVNFEAFQFQIDENPDNNFSEDVNWRVQENTVMARDYYRTGYCTPDQYVDGGDGDFIGCHYFITNTSSAASISVYIDYRTTPGTLMKAVLYDDSGTSPAPQIYSEEYTIMSVDLGTWVTLPFIPVSTGDDEVLGGQNYIAGIEFYFVGIGDLWIGADNSDFHWFNVASALRQGTSWYYITNVPMVRLNLGTAIIPPTFTSTRLDTCPQNWVYSYDVTASDASGLPLTFTMDDYYDGDLATITDHGNGTATITSTAALEDLGFVSGETFRFRIFVTNGTTRNEQYFYVSVKDDEIIGIDEEVPAGIHVYPNPANGEIFITNAENSMVEISNLIGEVVLSSRSENAQTTLNVSNLSVGTYLVRISNENGTFTQKLNITR
ncbi:MAG: T9SS type A sorting domain-containing protein [Bacteroidales bacterium]|nr:T9SS type A sorting domain-containing protein [Bacteroidales bacterium]